MRPRIAIPVPHSTDRKFSERSFPQYAHAVELCGGDPVLIPLDQPAADLKALIDRCDGVLLPGSNADVDPAKFHATPSPRTAASDPRRDAVDDLLLDDAYSQRKPVLGICYGLQSLNVYRGGSLVQHIPDFLPKETRKKVNHAIGGKVAVAHTVKIEPESRLAEIVRNRANPADSNHREGHGFSPADAAPGKNRAFAPGGDTLVVPVNSSHHQSANAAGTGLRIVARCTDDGIIEALEGTAPDHFVLAVQWHPERSVDGDEPSRAIFEALIKEAERLGKQG